MKVPGSPAWRNDHCTVIGNVFDGVPVGPFCTFTVYEPACGNMKAPPMALFAPFTRRSPLGIVQDEPLQPGPLKITDDVASKPLPNRMNCVIDVWFGGVGMVVIAVN